MSGYDLNTDLATVEAMIPQLTAKGADTMKAVGNHETSFFDNGIVAGSGIWGECLVNELGHASSGVINRLEKLGLFVSYENKDDDSGKWWDLTALGADVANYLAGNLNDVPVDYDAIDAAHDAAYVDQAVEEATEIAAGVTAKVGAKWIYLYAADGSLIAELRKDSAVAVATFLLSN